jgi:hypothetical protein
MSVITSVSILSSFTTLFILISLAHILGTWTWRRGLSFLSLFILYQTVSLIIAWSLPLSISDIVAISLIRIAPYPLHNNTIVMEYKSLPQCRNETLVNTIFMVFGVLNQEHLRAARISWFPPLPTGAVHAILTHQTLTLNVVAGFSDHRSSRRPIGFE